MFFQSPTKQQHFILFIDPESDDIITLVHLAYLIRKNFFNANLYSLSIICEFEEDMKKVEAMMYKFCGETIAVNCYRGSSERRPRQPGMSLDDFEKIEKKIDETNNTIIFGLSPAFDFLVLGARLKAYPERRTKIKTYLYWEYNLEIVFHTLRRFGKEKISMINPLIPTTLDAMNDSLAQFGKCCQFVLFDRENSLSCQTISNRDATLNRENSRLFPMENENETKFARYLREKTQCWNINIAQLIVLKIGDIFKDNSIKLEPSLITEHIDIEKDTAENFLMALQSDIKSIEANACKLDELILNSREYKFSSKLAIIKSIAEHAFQQMPLADPIITAYLDPLNTDLLTLGDIQKFYLDLSGELIHSTAESDLSGFKAQFIHFTNKDELTMQNNMQRLIEIIDEGCLWGIQSNLKQPEKRQFTP